MKDGYPYQSIGASQRDFQELLASFRQLSHERNAVRSIVERLYEALEGVQDTWSPRPHFRAV
jgi:predicted metal-dependent hydrolase